MRGTVTTWHKIGRGFHGWHAYGVHTWGHGYGGVVSSHGGTLEEYLPDAMPGALVYDAEHLRDMPAGDDFARLVIKGPMLDPQLAPWEHRAFLSSPARALPEGSPVTAADFGSLDYVGLGILRALYAQVPGIWLGTVTADRRVEWFRRDLCPHNRASPSPALPCPQCGDFPPGVDPEECRCPIGQWYSERCPACRAEGGAQ